MPALPLVILDTAPAVGIFAWTSSRVKPNFPFICCSCSHLQHISTRLCFYQLTAFSAPARLIKQTHVVDTVSSIGMLDFIFASQST